MKFLYRAKQIILPLNFNDTYKAKSLSAVCNKLLIPEKFTDLEKCFCVTYYLNLSKNYSSYFPISENLGI